jgi:hypothetical protein
MARYANNDSRMISHSLEANGLDFGYEFDGKGRYRYLELRPITRWQKGAMPTTAPPPKEKKLRPRKVKASLKKRKQP